MRWSTVLGFLAGILVVAVAVGAFLVTLPAREPVPAPSPVAIGGLPSPVSGASATPGPSASPSASSVAPSPSPSPSGAVSPSPSGAGSPTPSVGVTPSVFPSGSGSPDVGLRIGDKAPELSLDAMGGDGALVDTKLLLGKPVWVNFMGTYCPPCRDELPLMQKIQDQQGDSVAIILIDVREDEAVVQDFVDSLGVTLPVGLDRDGAASASWRALALPIHFWLDAEGIVREVTYGGAGPDVLMAGLRKVVPKATFKP